MPNAGTLYLVHVLTHATRTRLDDALRHLELSAFQYTILSVLARNAGVRAVAVIRAEPIGSTQLNYYGQSDTLYSANLTVRAYDVHNRTPLGSGVRQKVDFTALNADFKAKEAIQPNLGRLVGSPAFPITPTFPWLGLAGFVPLPVKFRIRFGAPLRFEGDPDDDDTAIEKHVEVVKDRIRELIAEGLEQRASWFV